MKPQVGTYLVGDTGLIIFKKTYRDFPSIPVGQYTPGQAEWLFNSGLKANVFIRQYVACIVRLSAADFNIEIILIRCIKNCNTSSCSDLCLVLAINFKNHSTKVSSSERYLMIKDNWSTWDTSDVELKLIEKYFESLTSSIICFVIFYTIICINSLYICEVRYDV